MRAIKYKTTILVAGILNGLNLSPFASNAKAISTKLGSLKHTFKLSDENGFSEDAKKLSNDWGLVKGDLKSAFEDAKSKLKKG